MTREHEEGEMRNAAGQERREGGSGAGDWAIRALEPGDVEAVVAIAVAAWEPIYAEFHRRMGDELFATACPNWQAEKGRQVRHACEPDSPALVCVAERDGEVVGFVTFRADERSGIGEIGNNAVRPDCQRQGIATALYRHALDRMRALGMRFARVGTGLDPSHAPARRAYEKAGFDVELPSVTYYRRL
jgi:ribosomal protein S18 acetylase RimI-like enzyme